MGFGLNIHTTAVSSLTPAYVNWIQVRYGSSF